MLQLTCCSVFTIHQEKSVLSPTQEIEFLGCVLNSVEVKIKLTDCISGKIISKIKKLLYEGKQTIRDLTSVIGSLVANFQYFRTASLITGNSRDVKSLHLNFKKANIMLLVCL